MVATLSTRSFGVCRFFIRSLKMPIYMNGIEQRNINRFIFLFTLATNSLKPDERVFFFLWIDINLLFEYFIQIQPTYDTLRIKIPWFMNGKNFNFECIQHKQCLNAIVNIFVLNLMINKIKFILNFEHVWKCCNEILILNLFLEVKFLFIFFQFIDSLL